MTSHSKFFEILFEYTEGLMELRALPGAARIFLNVYDVPGRELFCKQMDHRNLFFGCATRDGKGGAKENIIHIPCAWCDVDFKNTSLDTFKRNFAGFEVQPSAVVESGMGLHLYWKFKEPLSQVDIPALEDTNRRIASYLGGDLGACDAARILRIPGTLNLKYKPARPVKLAVLNMSEYSLSDFDFLPAVSQVVSQKVNNCDTGETWITTALRGVTEGHRHATGMRLAGYFLSKRLPGDVIESILELWNTKNAPSLSTAEITHIATNIQRYDNGDRKNGINLHIE